MKLGRPDAGRPWQGRVFSALLVALGWFGTGGSIPGAEAGKLVLENPHLALGIGAEDGAVHSVRDKHLDAEYHIMGLGFALATDRGPVEGLSVRGVKRGANTITLAFETDQFAIDLHYRLGPEDRFVEKWLELKAKDGEGCWVEQVVLEDAALGSEFETIHFHDDNTIWQCPINLFLRAGRGGCFAGLAYPYWDLDLHENDGFRLGFSPNYHVAAGTNFVSEKYFLGLFRKEGIYRYSQGPYPGRVPAPYVSFAGTGLGQHFKGGRIPTAAVEPEVLDWGEVWAMQAYIRHVLPDDLPLPEEGFWIWQNGWWAGLFDPKPEMLDQLQQAGVHDIMTAHTWYGRGNHPLAEPYLAQMRVEPIGFPKDASVAGMPGPAGPAAGLHVERDEVGLDKFTPHQYTQEFFAPPAMETFYQYGRKMGVHVSSFSLPGIYFEQRPEWASVDEEGKISEYLFSRRVSCPACDPYMEHLMAVMDHVFTKYRPRWWGFDGRWLSYWEVPAYRPGPKGLGFDTCYAEHHGHRPGDNLYKEWKNIQAWVRELRRRHPRMCLEQYLGLKRGGPWALRYFNCDDNYFETSGAVMNRFQTWHNQNDRFRPSYKNYGCIFGDNEKDFQTSVIACISTASYCQLGPGYRGLAIKENVAFLKKWRTWASEHYEYLKVKRDLFDCPGFGPVDGSAHIVGDDGFLFLFPTGDDAHLVRALIPINRWLGLQENRSSLYRMTEVHPREGRLLGIYRYGDEFAYDMPPNSPVVLSLQPAEPGAQPGQLVSMAEASQVVEVRAFGDNAPLPRSNYVLMEDGRLVRKQLVEGTSESGQRTQSIPDTALPELLTFGGSSSDVVKLGDLGLQLPATFALWMTPAEVGPDRRILSQSIGSAQQAGALRLADGQVEVWDGARWRGLLQEPVQPGVRIHLAIVFEDTGQATAYRDGQKQNTVSSGFDFAGTSALIGGKFLGSYGEPFAGTLERLRIYRRALAGAEIVGLVRLED